MGICSRREADRWVEEGRVTINGKKAEKGQMTADGDCIAVDGKIVSPSGEMAEETVKPVLIAYYKPRGIVCTTSDKDRCRNVVEAIGYPERIYPVGRLDKDSEGLLLLTNQGDLVNTINRARSYHEKEYVVTVDHPLTKNFLDKMADGVYLETLEQTTRPCSVWQDKRIPKAVRQYQFHIVLTQGLNRQIRRMCQALGYEVRRLKRIRIMKLELDGLGPGEWREIDRDMLGLPESGFEKGER